MPPELILHVCDFLSDIDLYHLDPHLPLSPRHKIRIQTRTQWIMDHIPPVLIRIFHGMEAILSLPVLPWDDQFLGSTGYIDHLKPHHMTYPIMIGEDLWNRPFLAFRTLDIQNQPAVDVIFQRYQDSSTRWACAHHGLGFTSSTMDVFRNEELHKNLSSLVREGETKTRRLF